MNHSFGPHRGFARSMLIANGIPFPEDQPAPKPLKSPEVCGFYLENTKIKEAKLHNIKSIEDFYFIIQVLNDEHIDRMQTVKHIRFQNTNFLKYLTNPHKIKINDIKLYDMHYQATNRTRLVRCKILDLYTEVRNGKIELEATIFIMDFGFYRSHIPCKELFDFPINLEHIQKLPPEFSRCKLKYNYPNDKVDPEVDDEFIGSIENIDQKCFTIKILGYEDDVYIVDVLNNQGGSIVEYLKKRFNHKIMPKSPEEEEESEHLAKCLELGFSTLSLDHSEARKPCPKRPSRYYHGAIHYFKYNLSLNGRISNDNNYIGKRLFKVKLITWSALDSIYIIPDDPDYFNNLNDYRREVATYIKKYDLERDDYKPEQYILGQKCLFKYQGELPYGKWLRGIVIDAPLPDSNSFFDYDNPNGNDNGFPVEDRIYRIQSIDYGFSCIKGPHNMRPVKNLYHFNKGHWAMRCKLFGLEQFKDGDRNEETCLDFLDHWIRKHQLYNADCVTFYALIRSDMTHVPTSWHSPEPIVDITLFNRFDRPRRLTTSDEYLEIMNRKKKIKPVYECINVQIIEKGLASDGAIDGVETSDVYFDNYVIQQLVEQNKIS